MVKWTFPKLLCVHKKKGTKIHEYYIPIVELFINSDSEYQIQST